MVLDRQQLTDAWSKRFDGLDQGYWITLNSKIHVKGLDDPHIPGKFIEFSRLVEKFIDQTNEYCYGRQYLNRKQDCKLTCLVGYEVGKIDGMVHCHIIAAHNGSTDRTVDDLKNIAILKWRGICNTGSSTQFVDVDAVGNVHDRIWYMAKQTTNHQRMFGEFNLSLH